MGRSPCCCHDAGVKKGPWTEEEDRTLMEHIQKHGGHVGSWRRLPKAAGLHRCSKSCRLRWTNYLRPDIKRGNFSDDEERLIIRLHSILGNKWSTIATHLEGRTDNEIKNYWNTHIRKKLLRMGVDPVTHQQLPPDHHHLDVGALATSPALPEALLWAAVASLGGLDSGLRQVQLLQQLLQLIVSGSSNDGSAADLIANLAAANAVVNLSSIVPNLQDQMNMLSPASYQPGYLCNISNFAEQDVVQELINATAPGVSSYAAANAVVNSSSIVTNVQDQMNMLSPANYQPGYLCNISNFAEQDVVQQLINATAPGVSSYAAAAAEPADQHCNTAAAAAAAFVSAAAYPRDVAAAVDRPVQEFAGLLEPMELPSLCSLESDSFWKDILEDSYRL